MTASTVRVAIVGAGGIAARHVEALSLVPEAAITAVVDIDRGRAERLAHACGAKVCATVEECVPHVDAVYVLTPAECHHGPVMAAIAGGRHVFVEKPLATCAGDGLEMVRAAEHAGVVLAVGLSMRFRDGPSRVRDVIRRGLIGEPVNAWFQRIGIGMTDAWPPKRPEPVPGIVLESFSHEIDLLHWWIGDVDTVAACLYATRPDLSGYFEDNAAITFGMASDAIASLHASWTSFVPWSSRGVIGTEGAVIVSGREQWRMSDLRLRTRDMPHEVIEVIDDDLDARPYRAEARHFIDCILDGAPPTTSGHDGLRALTVAEAILASHRMGRTITVRYPATQDAPS